MLVKETNEIYHTSKARIEIIHGNIFYLCYQRDVLLELDDFKESYAAFAEISANRKMRVIIDFPQFTSATDEARKFALDTKVEAIAAAFVFKSLAQRILLRAYYLFHKQDHPVKLFTEKTSALNWLESFA